MDDYKTLYVLLGLTIAMLAFNQYQILDLNSQPVTVTSNIITQQATQGQSKQAQVNIQEIAAKVLPKGIPDIYGSELKVSFDNVEGGLDILGKMDADLNPGKGGIKFADLTDGQKQRYLKIGFMIACEYCCGVMSLITKDGQPACGCAHSAAMRGLAKYLLTKHEKEYTDEQIVDQLAKWKALFFPQQTVEKYMQSQGIGSSQSLPNMVGGC